MIAIDCPRVVRSLALAYKRCYWQQLYIFRIYKVKTNKLRLQELLELLELKILSNSRINFQL